MLQDVLATPTTLCVSCGGNGFRMHAAREMMFGFRDEFRYEECLGCGALRLTEIPSDLGRYYPPHYYSFGTDCQDVSLPSSPLRRWAFTLRNSGQVLGRPWPWNWLAKFRPRPDFAPLQGMFEFCPRLRIDSAILDVGCGQGALLRTLASAGFNDLWGVDPYLPTDIHLDGRVHILSAEMSAIDGKCFDLIMMHHSLEHMADQEGALRQVSRLLDPQGVALIRIPLADSDPWNRYGTNWVELDAPRHLYLHTIASIKRLAEKCGLAVCRVEFDSDAFAYWGSELYIRDVPLVCNSKKQYRTPQSTFSADELAAYEELARQANRTEAGGRAAFYMRHL